MKERINPISKTSRLFVIMSALLCGTHAHAGITLTFTDNTNPSDPFPATGSVGTVTMGAGNEFRVVAANDTISGFGNKSITSDASPITWEFNDDGALISVNGADTTGGTDGSGNLAGAKTCNTPGTPTGLPAGPVVSPTEPSPGAVGSFLDAPFFGTGFNFVAPILGSNAGNLYGHATVSVDLDGGTMQINAPVMEAQWSNAYFMLGREDDGVNGTGISFTGTVSNVVDNMDTTASFDFRITANHIIQACEDTAGFQGQTTQWELVGTGVADIVSPEVPVSSAGTLAPTMTGTAGDNGRVTAGELGTVYSIASDIDSIIPDYTTDSDDNVVDARITQVCVGGCFAYTITGLTNGETVTVTLPLTAPIPSNAVLRKYINGAWTNYDTTTDTIMTAPGAASDCSSPGAYASGLNAGDFCLQVTITDGGANDVDGAADGTIVDPAGVATFVGQQANILLPAQTLDDAGGCSVSARPVSLLERADWLLVALGVLAFGLMAARGVRREQE